MGHEIDLKRYDIRTDLVIDTIDNNDDNIDTLVEVQGDIKITKVTVDDNVSRIIGKKKGRYTTIEFDDVTDTDNKNKVEDIFTLELNDIFDISKVNSVLIIGLGNRDSTPDSLGPKVVDDIVVTRHLFLLGKMLVMVLRVLLVLVLELWEIMVLRPLILFLCYVKMLNLI